MNISEATGGIEPKTISILWRDAGLFLMALFIVFAYGSTRSGYLHRWRGTASRLSRKRSETGESCSVTRSRSNHGKPGATGPEEGRRLS